MTDLGRIFLSYGHDEYTYLARQLKLDLERRGCEVWFDVERLVPGAIWETYIEEGLEWVSDAPGLANLVLLMTPHSVRRPDGYCLNELSWALSRGLTVIPLMVVDVEPPLSIARVQWLDLRDAVPLPERAARYSEQFDQLLRAIRGEPAIGEGVQGTLLRRLAPLPSGVEIREHESTFTGRRAARGALRAWLADPDGEKIYWITGKPGVGKTALASWLCARWPEVAAGHFFRRSDARRSDPRQCVRSIAYQLSTQLRDYQARLNALALDDIDEFDSGTLFEVLVVEPLAAGLPPPARPVVVVIDALDEAREDHQIEFAAVVATAFSRTPSWLRFVVTSRSESRVVTALRGQTPHHLGSSGEENEDDIREYVRRELSRHAPDGRAPEAAVEAVVRRSGGIFLYATYVCRELASGQLSPDRVDQFPEGLSGVYVQFFRRQFGDVERYRTEMRPVLEVICAAQGPPSIDMLTQIFAWDDYQGVELIRALGALFDVREEGILPFHASVVDWLVDADSSGEYFVSRSGGHRRLAEWGWQEYRRVPATIPPYLLAHLAVHMLSAGRRSDVAVALTDFDVVSACCTAGLIYELILQYDMLLADEGLATADRSEVEAFARFVRTDRHVLEQNPLLLLQQAANRPGESVISAAANRALRSRPTPRPWIRWLNKPETRSACEMTYMGRNGGMTACDCSPDGRRIVGGDGEQLVVWDVSSGRRLLGLVGHTRPVTSCSFSPGGEYILSASYDGTMRLWDSFTGEHLEILAAPPGGVASCAFSPEGEFVVHAAGPHYDNRLGAWDCSPNISIRSLRTGVEVARFANEGSVEECAFSHDGTQVIAAYYNEKLVLWDVKTSLPVTVMEWAYDHVTTCAFTPDGRVVVAGSTAGTYWGDVKLFDAATGGETRTLVSGWGAVNTCTVSPEGRLVAAGSNDQTLKVWDLGSGEERATLAEHAAPITGCAFAPDGRHLFSAASDRTIKLWDVGRPGPAVRKHLEMVNSCAFSADGRLLVAGSGARPYSGPQLDLCMGELKIWDARTGAEVATLLSDNWLVVEACAFSADGETVVVCTTGSVETYHVATGQRVHEVGVSGWEFAVSRHGTRVVTWGHSGLDLIDPWAPDPLAHIALPGADCRTLALSADGRTAVLALGDASLSVWDVAISAHIVSMPGRGDPAKACAVSPDGALVASAASGSGITVWNTSTGGELWTVQPGDEAGESDDGRDTWPTCSFSQNGSFLAGSLDGKRLQVWDVAMGELVGEYWLPSYAKALAWSTDGRRIAVGDSGGYVHLLQLEP